MSIAKYQKKSNQKQQQKDRVFSRTLKYCDRSSTLSNYESNKSHNSAKINLNKHIQTLKNIEKCLEYVQKGTACHIKEQILNNLVQFKELPHKLKCTQSNIKMFTLQTSQINQSLKLIQNNSEAAKNPSNSLSRTLNNTQNQLQNISHQILILEQKSKKFFDQKLQYLNSQIQSFLKNVQKKLTTQRNELNLSVLETKKQINEFRAIMSKPSIKKVNHLIAQTQKERNSFTQQIYSTLGLMRCQIQSNKDKKRKIRVQQLLQQREHKINERHGKKFLNRINRSSLLTDAQLLLTTEELQQFLNRNNRVINKETNMLSESLERLRASYRSITTNDRQRELEFYRIYERINKVRLRIKAVKKKTLIEIRKIEDINTQDPQIQCKIDRINDLINRSIQSCWRNCQERLLKVLQDQ